MELGGNISLNGFSNLDRDTMVIVKKLVGSYVKTLSEGNDNFKSLSLNLNSGVEESNPQKYSLEGVLVADNEYKAEAEETNLMIAIDKVLKNLESQCQK
ncbi:MAG: hypothetical protein ACOCZQ_03775 [Nanoarchaeota archaeon]